MSSIVIFIFNPQPLDLGEFAVYGVVAAEKSPVREVELKLKWEILATAVRRFGLIAVVSVRVLVSTPTPKKQRRRANKNKE
ncbi:hypothetical protein HYALB_00009083 [Hymenoscyphus albidus]|uniref:Uncharacterized protein n=1 Tax=Hymenoscyphus albidus TaxID=595503 RepID=A0A9N9LKF3_9HELO|nr:hypothetical protein HYALB_00009083 [Hymenoscyphus albidus]